MLTGMMIVYQVTVGLLLLAVVFSLFKEKNPLQAASLAILSIPLLLRLFLVQ